LPYYANPRTDGFYNKWINDTVKTETKPSTQPYDGQLSYVLLIPEVFSCLFDEDRYTKPDSSFHFVADFDADPESASQNDADPPDPDLNH
jgi:hypothetical protein